MHLFVRSRRFSPIVAVVALGAATVAGAASAAASPAPTTPTVTAGSRQFVPTSARGAKASTTQASSKTVRTVAMPGGASITVQADGTATETAADGHTVATRTVVPAQSTELGSTSGLPDDLLRDLFSPAATRSSTSVVAVLAHGVTVTGAALGGKNSRLARRATTSDGALNTALARVGARSLTPLPSSSGTSGTAVVVDVADDVTTAASTLRAQSGVAYAEVDQPVSSQSIGDTPLPKARLAAARRATSATAGSGLPTNYALTNSLAAYLNGNGVDAMGAYRTLTSKYGQLPGTGEIITNVSVGDLTDQAMADAGDSYVQFYGPTTVVQHGQRYLDLPSMPLIPTYVAGPDGSLDPTGATEGVDPTLGEVMLDFGVMSPLPHDRQRAGALGSGDTDLLGIAPGAKYRLVVPQQPDTDQIATAMLAAARQTPRPNVITASLGEGTDTIGFPGRYLEDDPLLESVIHTIVQQYGIVVTISANDGTRLYTPTPVNPDGGSTATDVTTNPSNTTDVDDDAMSTTPSRVLDSGAIAVGATTLDDVLTQPGQPTGTQVRTGTFATTRVNGSTAYSSGFGSRVDVSAPGDGIAVFDHTVGGGPSDVTPELTGGTSASAPEVAAAAAVVQQASRLAGAPLGPKAIRSLLERTGRHVANPAQSDRPAAVGPQVDLTAAVRSVLGPARAGKPSIVRVSVAHHVDLGDLEGDYSEDTDPQTLDLTGDAPSVQGSGEGLLGPVTFGVDTVGLTGSDATYQLQVGHSVFRSSTPSIRITPTQLLTAAGDPVVSTSDRAVTYTISVLRRHTTVASTQRHITVGPTDGTYTVARAPVVPSRVTLGSTVHVSYDLTGVRTVSSPRLVVSTVGAWSPTGSIFTPAYSVDLTQTKGTLTLPASAFTGGGGVYGIGIAQQTETGTFTYNIYADMASLLVVGHRRARPSAPLLTAGRSGGVAGHDADVTRAHPDYRLQYDVRSVPGARKTIYEISATGPTLFNSLNTVTNAFGTERDDDGVSTPSVAFTGVAATHGTLRLSALSLPTDAVFYNVRVFAADSHGHPIGEASPTSGLSYDDGLPPNQGVVRSFDAVSGDDSVVAVENPTGGQTVYHFDPADGTYGTAITSDDRTGDGYQVVGVDTGLHRVVLLHFDGDDQTVAVETWSTATGARIGATTVATSAYLILGGRVDAAHHRAELLASRGSDRADLVVTVDLTDGSLGTPVDADTGTVTPGSFSDLELAPGTGDALLFRTTGGGGCFTFGSWSIAEVDPATSTVTQHSGPTCLAAAAPDAKRSSLEAVTYRTASLNFAGTAALNTGPLDDLGSLPSGGAVRQESPSLLGVDGVNDVVAVGFSVPQWPMRVGSALGFPQNSNSTGQLAELDPQTGATTQVLNGMEFGTTVSQGVYNGATERRLQFDPHTRTAWTFSADGAQLQAFRY